MFRRILPRSDFFKNVLTLASGTSFAQAIPILIAPILTRLFSPEDFGLFGIYFSLVGIISIIATARYELAIVLPKSEDDSLNLAGLSMIFSFILTILLFAIVLIFNTQICELLNSDRISFWLYFLPLTLLSIGVYQSFNYWLIRKKAFKASAINRVSHKVGESSVNLGMGVTKFADGLIIGELFGRITMCFVAGFQAFKRGFSVNDLNWNSIKLMMKKYKQFPIYGGGPALINSVSMNLPMIFINNFFAMSITGFFNLTRQILSAPISLLSRNVSQVLLQKLSSYKNEKKQLTPEIFKIAKALAIVALVFTPILLLFGPFLFKVFFGPKWEISGLFARILVISFAVKFVVSPLSVLFVAIEKIKIASFWQLFYFGLILLLWVFAKFKLDIYQFLIAYAIIEVIAYLCYFFLIITAAKKFDKEIAGEINS